MKERGLKKEVLVTKTNLPEDLAKVHSKELVFFCNKCWLAEVMPSLECAQNNYSKISEPKKVRPVI